MGHLLSRALIDAMQRDQTPVWEVREVPSPELGADLVIFVRTITSAGCERYQRRALAINDEAAAHTTESWDQLPSARIPLVLETVCDAEGTLLFTQKDVPWLEQQPVSLIYRWFRAAYTLNKLGEEVEAIETAAKNSGSSQSGDSGTASHSNGVVLFPTANLSSPETSITTGGLSSN